MKAYDVHFVGSIPLSNSREVFETVGRLLGPHAPRIPDGETGERSHWLGWIEPLFANHPAFEPTGQISRVHATSDPRPLHRIKDGFLERGLQFSNLRIAEHAIASFAEFTGLKRRQVIHPSSRFQVSIANPISVVHRFVVDEFQQPVVEAYGRAMLGELEALAAAIPHDQLAIQFDIAQHVFKPMETGESNRFGANREEMLAVYTEMAAHWGNAVPADAELVYHLCYGDNAHRHAVEPATLAVQVQFANALSARIDRTIQLIHMSVPRDRHDDSYFEPLQDLNVRPETQIALGLIHQTDGVVGTRRRIATAEKYLNEFLIATECGFGRRPRDSILPLLDIHAELAGVL